MKITYYRPIYEWKKDLENEPIFWVTPDHDQHGGDVRHFDHTDSRVTEDGTRFVARTNFEAKGEGCPWAEIHTRPTVSEGGRRITWVTTNWGSPCTFVFHYDLERWQANGFVEESKEYDLGYDDNIVFEIPMDARFFRLQGRTATLHKIDIVAGQSSRQLSYVREFADQQVNRVVYHIEPPADTNY